MCSRGASLKDRARFRPRHPVPIRGISYRRIHLFLLLQILFIVLLGPPAASPGVVVPKKLSAVSVACLETSESQDVAVLLGVEELDRIMVAAPSERAI